MPTTTRPYWKTQCREIIVNIYSSLIKYLYLSSNGMRANGLGALLRHFSESALENYHIVLLFNISLEK